MARDLIVGELMNSTTGVRRSSQTKSLIWFAIASTLSCAFAVGLLVDVRGAEFKTLGAQAGAIAFLTLIRRESLSGALLGMAVAAIFGFLVLHDNAMINRVGGWEGIYSMIVGGWAKLAGLVFFVFIGASIGGIIMPRLHERL